MTIGIDSSVLLNFYQARAGVGATGAGGTSKPQVAPTAPWKTPPTPAQTSAAVKAAMAGHSYIDESAAKLDLPGASQDYKKLFALYQGLDTLSNVASQINGKNLTGLEKGQISSTFHRGLSEVTDYIANLKLEKVRLVEGEVGISEKAKLAVPNAAKTYVTPPLVNSTSAEVPAFQGNVVFNISIKRVNTTFNIPIDLAGMNATPRTIGNVINYMNDQLQAAGVETRFQSTRVPGQPRTITAGGKTVTLPPTSDQWALTVKRGSSEAVTFSAPQTAGAVYVAQTVGDPDPDKKASTADSTVRQQLLKFQTDTVDVPPPLQPPGEANWVDGRVFSDTLDATVGAVHATQVGPDGSVYVLADVTGATSGQAIRGSQDVALLKYDSAGKLLYTRTLGAADKASGLGLAVSASGQIAVAGSITGALNGSVDGALNSTGAFAGSSDSFVSLYDTSGQEIWTERRGARKDDSASQVAFGADGTVYVAGRSASALPGATAGGGWDGYIEAFKTGATGKPQTLFTQTVGGAGVDKPQGMVVDGTALVTASLEDGHAILRRFDVSGGAPVLLATRDLGDLQGGDIAGLALDGNQIVLAGSTANAGFGSATVTNPLAGGVDAFAMRLSSDLSPGAGDNIAFYGGSGDDKATSLAVAGGEVWLGGSAGTDLPGQPPVGTKDGFLANLDVDAGTVGWSRRFTGANGRAAPTAIAVDPAGASVLDRIGLPSGLMDLSASPQLTAVSAVRAGDQFTIGTSNGPTRTITIDAHETLDTLAQKIRRASGFQAKVAIGTSNGARSLTITASTGSALIEIGPGKDGKDALPLLGLPPGVVRQTTTIGGVTAPADGKGTIYGLSLGTDLKLTSKEQIAHALADVTTAMGIIRRAYKDLVAAASPKPPETTAKAQSHGPVQVYLTNQIANYQAALNRLTGGG